MSKQQDPARVTTVSRELAKQVAGFIDAEGRLWDETPLTVLHHRSGPEEFALGAEYCGSSNAIERIAGALILSQLGGEERKFLTESVDLLIPMLQDSDLRVVDHAATALGHQRDPRAVPHLVALDEHPDGSIRHAVVLGLTGHNDPRAVASLIKLSKDEELDVRNWAVFALASLVEVDTRRVRQVLFDAMADEDDEIMGEAMVGLAARGDTRVVHALLKWWKKERPFGLTLEAAALIAAPELVPPLQKLLDEMDSRGPVEWKKEFPDWQAEHPDWRPDLAYALGRCKGEIEAP
jgi:HEAT repeat protein